MWGGVPPTPSQRRPTPRFTGSCMAVPMVPPMLGSPTPARIPRRPPAIVFFIAGVAVFLNVLDLLSGPVGLSMTKLTIVLSGVHVLVLLADVGRTRLARYCAHDRRTRGAARVRVEPGLGVDHAACQLAYT